MDVGNRLPVSRRTAVLLAAALAGVLVAALVAGVLAASGRGPFDRETRLEAALQRVAATDATRGFVEFGDTAALVEVSGRGDAEGSDPWYALRAYGTGGMVAASPEEAARAGLRPLDAGYAVSAGAGPATVALLSGGQDGGVVTGALSVLGWHADGGRLVAPAARVPPDLAGLAVWLGQVRADGPDVVYGGPGARLDDLGRPAGATLAADPRYAALAGCLGDVVAAALAPGTGGAVPTGGPGGIHPAAVAVGIQRPAGANAGVRSVVCTAWESAADAGAYAGALPDALATGSSSFAGPFAQVYTNTEIRTLGGDQHVVRLRADTGEWRDVVFQGLRNGELPGLRPST